MQDAWAVPNYDAAENTLNSYVKVHVHQMRDQHFTEMSF